MKINSKKKGNLWENKFAAWLCDNGVKAWKDSGSGAGTREKADCGNNLNIHFEVKAVAGINLKAVFQKAEYECEKTHNKPVIAIHFNGYPDDKFLMVMDNYYFLELLKGDKVEVAEYQKPEMKWALQNLKESARKVLSFLDKNY